MSTLHVRGVVVGIGFAIVDDGVVGVGSTSLGPLLVETASVPFAHFMVLADKK